MTSDIDAAPKEWRGRVFEDVDIGSPRRGAAVPLFPATDAPWTVGEAAS